MKTYTPKQFNIGELKGLSRESIDDHLKLYEMYVKNVNLIQEQILNAKELGYPEKEMQRRLGFEYGGMKNHEIYFESLSDGAKNLSPGGKLYKAIEDEWGSFDKWLELFKATAQTRGVGWAMLFYDKENNKLLNAWVDEQQLGHLMGADAILALDMWEHSFVLDYRPSGKVQYVNDFFENLNWEKIEKKFEESI
jgi:Fe-Mn family superoxide dismutase